MCTTTVADVNNRGILLYATQAVTNMTDGITPYFCGQHGLRGSGNSLGSVHGDYSPRVLGLHPQDDGTILHRNVGRVGLQYGVNGTRLDGFRHCYLRTDRHTRKIGGLIAHVIQTQHTLEDQVVEGGAGKVPLMGAVGAA